MKKIQVSTDRILLILIVVLLWFTMLLKACEQDTEVDLQPTAIITNNDVIKSDLNDYEVHKRIRYKRLTTSRKALE
jgi:hypothetical protein